METISDIQINAKYSKRVRKLKPILRGWIRAIGHYCCEVGEPPYYYNERANISLLAAGAWEAGAAVLEEYQTSKKSKEVQRKPGRGRCDLFVCTNGTDFQIEAKHVWMRADARDKTVKNRIRKGFEEAFKDAGRNTETTARVACVFFPISFRLEKFPQYKNKPDKLIKSQLSRYLKEFCYSLGLVLSKEHEVA